MITKLIFGVLCGILYIIGLPFGWNYQETSVYIWIHLWPILCILSTIPMLYYSVKRAMLKDKGYMATFGIILYNFSFVLFYCNVLEHYSIGTRFGTNPIRAVRHHGNAVRLRHISSCQPCRCPAADGGNVLVFPQCFAANGKAHADDCLGGAGADGNLPPAVICRAF